MTNVKILLASHGTMCEGLLDTLKIFSNNTTNIFTIPFYTDRLNFNADDELDKYIKSISKNDLCLIFTDLMYGSVNQKIVCKTYGMSNVHVISGMNLALLLELLSGNPETLTQETISEKVQNCQKSIVYMREQNVSFREGDE